MEKLIEDNKIEAQAEVELYLMILERQKKFQDVLQVLTGPLSKYLPNHLDFVNRRKAMTLQLLASNKATADAFKSLAEAHPDQLEYYEGWIDASFRMDEAPPESPSHKKRSYVQTAIDVLRKFEKSPKKQWKLRAPYFARLFLYTRLKSRMEDTERSQEMCAQISKSGSDLLMDFYTAFGNKPCFFKDCFYILSKYETCREFLPQFIKEINSNVSSNPDGSASIDDIQRNLHLDALIFLNEHATMTREEKVKKVCLLMGRYSLHLKEVGDLLPNEVNPADGHCILAAHILMDDTKDESLLISAILLLKMGLECSPSNHFMKVLLLSLYNNFGAGKLCGTIFESLDIKYIQYDSLGYLISTPLASLGLFSLSSSFYSSAGKFYTTTQKDVS